MKAPAPRGQRGAPNADLSFISRFASVKERIWPQVENSLAGISDVMPVTAQGFIQRLVAGTSPTARLDAAFEVPEVARVAYLPLWQIEAYQERGTPVRNREILEASLFQAACLGFCAVRIWDDLVDQDKPDVPIEELLVANLLYLKSIRRLQQVFPAKSEFWSYHDAFWMDYTRAVGSELERDKGGLAAFDESAIRLVGDKAAPLKSFPVAVALEADQGQDVERLNELMDDFNQAAQLANDLQSLRRDLEARHYTFPIAGAALAVGYEPGSHPPIDGLYGALFESDCVLETHARARWLLQSACAKSRELEISDLEDCLAWHLAQLRRSERRWEGVVRRDARAASIHQPPPKVGKGSANGFE